MATLDGGEWSRAYNSAHRYLQRRFPKAGACEECGARGKTEYSLIHGRQVSRRREDYRELCLRCHRQYDVGGERCSNAKLNRAAVLDIRRRRADGELLKSLAREYGVTIQAISLAARGVNWRGVV